MNKNLIVISAMVLGANSLYALGTNAGTTITNDATLSYSAGGVAQPDVSTTTNNTGDSFVVDKKIDMTLVTTDTDQVNVSPGQTNRETNFKFKNEGNDDQYFKFTVDDLTGGEADYDNDPDSNNIKAGSFEIQCTYTDENGAAQTAGYSADLTIKIKEDTEATCVVRGDIKNATDGAIDGDIMNIELLAKAYKDATNPETETTDGDTQSGTPDVVFADGESIANGSTAGNLGTEGNDASSKGDAAGDGEEKARSGYIVQTPVLSVEKKSCVVSDPVNNTSNPKRIPGAVIRYMFDIKNAGTGDVTDLNITDVINDNLILGGTVASAKKKENQSSCDCTTEPSDSISGSTDVSGQTVTIEGISVAHGATQGTAGENHTCVSIETEIE